MSRAKREEDLPGVWPESAHTAEAGRTPHTRIERLAASPERLSPDDLLADGAALLSVEGRSVAYTERGSGEEAIIFLHCFGGSSLTWTAVQEALAADFRTVAIDLWGFGASCRPPTLAVDDWPRQVFGTMEALGIASAVMVGHSMGGRVALACAVQAPDRVRALALLDSDGVQAGYAYLFFKFMARSRLLPLLLRAMSRDPRGVLRMLRASYAPYFPITQPLIARYHRQLCVRGTDTALSSLGRTYPGRRLQDIIRRVRCPALLLWGADDRITPPQRAMKLLKDFADAELLILPHAAHVPQEECPQTVIAHLRRFARAVTA